MASKVPTVPKRNCYANSLGGCNTISGEHIVTRSLFGDGPVLTRGLQVPHDTPVGIDRLVANILCQKHNSELSPLDSEAKKLGDACLSFIRSVRSSSVTVSGHLIERWLLKLALGSSVSGWLHGIKVLPPPAVVAAVFGRHALPSTVGMFGVAGIGRETPRGESVSFHFFVGQSLGSVGLFVSIHGLPLLLSVCLDNAQAETRARGTLGGFDVSKAQLRQHPEELVMSNRDESAKLSIIFEWHGSRT